MQPNGKIDKRGVGEGLSRSSMSLYNTSKLHLQATTRLRKSSSSEQKSEASTSPSPTSTSLLHLLALQITSLQSHLFSFPIRLLLVTSMATVNNGRRVKATPGETLSTTKWIKQISSRSTTQTLRHGQHQTLRLTWSLRQRTSPYRFIGTSKQP